MGKLVGELLVGESWRYCTYLDPLHVRKVEGPLGPLGWVFGSTLIHNHNHQPRSSNVSKSDPLNPIEASRGHCLASALWAAFAL